MQGKIEYSYTQNVADNTSTITATLYVRKYHNSMTLTTATTGSWKYTLTIDGEGVKDNRIQTSILGWYKLTTVTKTVSHNSNGEKTITLSGSVSGPTGTAVAGGTTSGSKAVALSVIPRASSITSAGAVTLGEKCSVKWTPLSTNFAYKLKFVSGDVSYRKTGEVSHRIFRDIIDYLDPRDMLVVNSSKVIPARLLGVTEKTGSSMELLLLRMLDSGEWETLVRPGKRAKVGAKFVFGDILTATVTGIVDGGNRTVRFDYDTEKYATVYEVLDAVGNMPLPPYITKKLENKSDYQTVYAKEEGSAAAPTAGLHFTDELLDRIKAKGVGYGEVTLHVGLGTFRPVKVDKIEEHLMHGEYFHISDEVAEEINCRRAAGGRIIAVGTTSARVLESVGDENGIVHAIDGETSIFIYPGYKFKATDALITNFHLPESTLIMLVSALAGKENVMNAYETAVADKYRFFSFGDATFIV